MKPKTSLPTASLLGLAFILTSIGPAAAAGGPSQALSFAGGNQLVIVTNSPALNVWPLTVTAWIRTSQSNSSASLFYKEPPFQGVPFWSFDHFNGNLSAGISRSTASVQVSGSGSVADGTWRHVGGWSDLHPLRHRAVQPGGGNPRRQCGGCGRGYSEWRRQSRGLEHQRVVRVGPHDELRQSHVAPIRRHHHQHHQLQQIVLGLAPVTAHHYRAVASNSLGVAFGTNQTFLTTVPGDLNGDGIVNELELNTVLTNYWPNSPWLELTNVAGLGGTNVTFALTNSTAGAFSVEYTTNLTDWLPLGSATPRYEFTDANPPASPQRYYRLRWP